MRAITVASVVADRLSAVHAETGECEAIGEALADRLGRREMTLAAFDKANEPITADEALTAGLPSPGLRRFNSKRVVAAIRSLSLG